ncbi:MAG: hypothetical protein HOP19_20805 [Acidobacteria bacterium]|nr:hypothetical protein [Acidobacteriota bacterium]
MARQTKPKSKRTQVKDLNVTQQELTTDEASKVKGGKQWLANNFRFTSSELPASFNPKEISVDQSVPWKK